MCTCFNNLSFCKIPIFSVAVRGAYLNITHTGLGNFVIEILQNWPLCDISCFIALHYLHLPVGGNVYPKTDAQTVEDSAWWWQNEISWDELHLANNLAKNGFYLGQPEFNYCLEFHTNWIEFHRREKTIYCISNLGNEEVVLRWWVKPKSPRQRV